MVSRKQWGIFYVSAFFLIILLVIQLSSIHLKTKVAVLDVGQGDAILIQTPEHHNVLIDAGPDSRVVEQLGGQLGFFDKTIDLFVLTHPHRDHFVGFFEVAKQYRVRRVLLAGVAATDPLYAEFLNFLKANSIDIVLASQEIDWQIGPHLYLDVLYPLEGQSLVGQIAQNFNNTSLVTRLAEKASAGWRFLALFPGDAEREEERELLMSGQDVESVLLKAGHHGSRTSTSLPFLQAVRPQDAVISAGKDNKFGHPHAETLEKLKAIPYWVTAKDGVKVFWF